MIIRELLEAQLPWQSASQLKEKRLRALLTPEVVAANHDLLIHLIGSKITIDEIDALQAHLRGDLLDAGDVDDVRSVLLKLLAFANPVQLENGRIKVELGKSNARIHYTAGKWHVNLPNRVTFGVITKKFNEPEEVVDFIKKTHAIEVKRDSVLQKLDAELDKYNSFPNNIPDGLATVTYSNKHHSCEVNVLPSRINIILITRGIVGGTISVKTPTEAVEKIKQHLGVE